MSGSASLEDALEGIKSRTSKDRAQALEDLKRIVRGNRAISSTTALPDKVLHTVFEALFEVVESERFAWLRAKTAATKSSAESRLWTTANALRVTVEASAGHAKTKTFKALLDHLLAKLSNPGRHDYCPSFALEYTKALRNLLSHQHHVEHLQHEDWKLAIDLCLDFIKATLDSTVGEDYQPNILGSTPDIVNPTKLSHRSSRSVVREPQSSQSDRHVGTQITLENLTTLTFLTGANNAPFEERHVPILTVLINFLQKARNRVVGGAHHHALATINNVLRWTRVEATALTTSVYLPLCRIVKSLWQSRGDHIRDEILISQLYLQPYLQISLNHARHDLDAEVRALYDSIRSEYGKRKEKDQLHTDDLSFGFSTHSSAQPGQIFTPIFRLQCAGPRAERGWMIGCVLANLVLVLSRGFEDGISADVQDTDEVRPVKRQKTTSHWEELMQDPAADVPGRLCSLQILLFVLQQRRAPTKFLSDVLHNLCIAINEDNTSISSWSFLVLACCAAQFKSSDICLQSRWTDVWQIATRAITTPSSCRSAAYLLKMLIELRLISRDLISVFIRNLTTSLGLYGPSVLADTTCDLLILVIQSCRELIPSAVSALQDNILTWLFRNFTPSRFAEPAYQSFSRVFRAQHVTALVRVCLNQKVIPHERLSLSVWSALGQAWLRCQEQSHAITYLLLSPSESDIMHTFFNEKLPRGDEHVARQHRDVGEAVCLANIREEITGAARGWADMSQNRGKTGTPDAVRSLAQACCIMLEILHDGTFGDSRTQSVLQASLHELLTSTVTYLASAECDRSHLDAALEAFLEILPTYHQTPSPTITNAAAQMCKTITRFLTERLTSIQTIPEHDSLDTDIIDGEVDSQESQPDKSDKQHDFFVDHISVSSSTLALRSSVALYATSITALSNPDNSPYTAPSSAAVVLDYVLAMPLSALCASRRMLKMLRNLGVMFAADETERLIGRCADQMLAKYSYNRSEVALCTVLDIMQGVMTIWTDRTHLSIYELGMDIYNWFTTVASAVLSPATERRLAQLLLQLHHIDPEYGRERDNSTLSTRTTLFNLLARQVASLQYFLAEHIHTIFANFTLQTHGRMFDDLQTNLPSAAEWQEGMALRLLFLANMASAHRSLLRQCIYYIFETAGQVTATMKHAAYCISHLTATMNFPSPQVLFQLFAPQFIFSWLGNHSLSTLPYSTFGYESLGHLLRHNEIEIAAQSLVRGNEDDLEYLVSSLKTNAKALAESSFTKALAYAICWDVQASTSEATKNNETRLRNAVGAKDVFRRMVMEGFATVMGYFFLTMEQGDVEEGWLRRKPTYSHVADAYEEMKGYSSSDRSLPPMQQPSFLPKTFFEKIERLCRRANQDPLDPWTTSSFSLAIRILLDALHVALGSLHACLMLRRMRLLISHGGKFAFSGFPLEILLRSLRPLLSDSECADDTIGILQYLFHHSRSHMTADLCFLNGCVLLTVLQMAKYSITSHESTTQETQHARTVARMRSFHVWLTSYLEEIHAGSNADEHSLQAYVRALGSFKLPGNARRNSAESRMLLIILDQFESQHALLTISDCQEALLFLSCGFELPESIREDCLEDPVAAAKYSGILWHLLKAPGWSTGFCLWAARVIGRSFSVTGIRPKTQAYYLPSTEGTADQSNNSGVTYSQHKIISCLSDLSLTGDNLKASLADHTLRRILASIVHQDEATILGQILPDSVASAIWEGTFRYSPAAAIKTELKPYDDKDLRSCLVAAPSLGDEEWFNRLALTLCRYGSQVPLVSGLAVFVDSVKDLVPDLLPPIIHLLLAHELNGNQVLKHELSASLSSHLDLDDARLRTRQEFFLRLLLYLRGRRVPGEATVIERLRWLNVDLLRVSITAVACHMPSAALLFAESALAPSRAGRRTSGRSVASQVFEESRIDNELLLDIFKLINEPDSFYGVKRAATITTVLDELEYEENGLHSLIFHSALTDSEMRVEHKTPDSGFQGATRSLAMLNLNSLTYALSSGNLGSTSVDADETLDTARRLQQWDIALPDGVLSASSTCFSMYQQLSRSRDIREVSTHLQHLTTSFVNLQTGPVSTPTFSWCNVLASLAEAAVILDVTSTDELMQQWTAQKNAQEWTDLTPYQDCSMLINNRAILYGTLAQNSTLSQALHTTVRQCRLIEAEALVEVSQLARGHNVLQEALSASNQLHLLARQGEKMDLNIHAAAKLEMASALWMAGQNATSIQLLQETIATLDAKNDSIGVGRPGLLAQLGHQLAEARLERPDDILSNYLTPAIDQLKGRVTGEEAGKVYNEFALFCDQQLSDAGNIEDFDRISKLRQKKKEDLLELEQLRAAKKPGQQKSEIDRLWRQTKTWISVDEAEYRRLKSSRDIFLQQSLRSYMLALRASDKYNIRALRFFAMWLENAEDAKAAEIVDKNLHSVPCWKLVLLLNQIMSRLDSEQTVFQRSLRALTVRICSEHPYHSLHHLFAFTRKPDKTGAAKSRYDAASEIRQIVSSKATQGELLGRFFRANNYYSALAASEVAAKGKNTRISIKDVPYGEKIAATVPGLDVPPATINLQLQPDGDYGRAPKVLRFSSTVSIMGGISSPKVLTAIGTDGKEYKQLFKSGNDDLRQDAIMEQVFEEVSKMLQNHKSTRQRHLHVRTYKVIPLSSRSGILEFVANTAPLDEFLQPAHRRYHPQDMTANEARECIGSVKDQSVDVRIKEYRKICERIQPVLRYFFIERFNDPDEWFEKRINYTRTTAAMSMLGHVLGLGDRHCSNILLDERSGEAVHIDLGIAFEAGRVLPIPELVPFRLTRDIVDGMGITKTEGTFRRCCEFTMEALREDKESIMTLLNVLRYDPLHSWTVSPLRAKRMQEAASRNQSDGKPSNGDRDENTVRKKEQGAGEADRALSMVEKKLSKTLSTPATVNELIRQATDERNLATLFQGWAAFF